MPVVGTLLQDVAVSHSYVLMKSLILVEFKKVSELCRAWIEYILLKTPHVKCDEYHINKSIRQQTMMHMDTQTQRGTNCAWPNPC